MLFETEYNKICSRINIIDPIAYGNTRNYINGDVTYLSPYISRGVISTRQVLESVLSRGYEIHNIESFVKELLWRDYFQRVAQVKNVFQDIKQPQTKIANFQIPRNVLLANTGITGVDHSISKLYESGYMHNHCRMYTASLVCNIAGSHWFNPSRWMYYHLLDGDFASNACSWQWVAGSNSTKKYYANQENINKYTYTHQSGTYLDADYQTLADIPTPELLNELTMPELTIDLPSERLISVDVSLPTFIYNYYNLDPIWHKEVTGNRILLIDPEHFRQYPVSAKCIDFMIKLSENIPEIQIYVGSFESLMNKYSLQQVVYKEHPLNKGYQGVEESRDWICENVTGYYPSFFAYWKKTSKNLDKKQKNSTV